MKKALLAALVLLPLQSFAASETRHVTCSPVPFKNEASVEGSLTIDISEDGEPTAVNGVLNLTVKRVGDNYSPETLENLAVSGTAVSVIGVEDGDGVTAPVVAVKLDSISDSRVQFMSLSLNLRTVTANSWVRAADGVKYFANCKAF